MNTRGAHPKFSKDHAKRIYRKGKATLEAYYGKRDLLMTWELLTKFDCAYQKDLRRRVHSKKMQMKNKGLA